MISVTMQKTTGCAAFSMRPISKSTPVLPLALSSQVLPAVAGDKPTLPLDEIQESLIKFNFKARVRGEWRENVLIAVKEGFPRP